MPRLHFLLLSEKPEVGKKIQQHEQRWKNKLAMALFASYDMKHCELFNLTRLMSRRAQDPAGADVCGR